MLLRRVGPSSSFAPLAPGLPLRAAACPPGSQVCRRDHGSRGARASDYPPAPPAPRNASARGRAGRCAPARPARCASRPPRVPFPTAGDPDRVRASARARSVCGRHTHGVVVVARPQARSPFAHRRPGGGREDRLGARGSRSTGVSADSIAVLRRARRRENRSTNGTTANDSLHAALTRRHRPRARRGELSR